jgi:hypothetical protein
VLQVIGDQDCLRRLGVRRDHGVLDADGNSLSLKIKAYSSRLIGSGPINCSALAG